MTGPRERLPGLVVTRTADVDEALDAVTRVFLPHRIRMLQRTSGLDMQLNALELDTVTAGYLRYGPEIHMVTTETSHYHVNIPLCGATESRCGGRDAVVSTPERAAVFMPGAQADIRWGAGSAQLCLMLARHAMERDLERLLGRQLTRPLEFAVAMDLMTEQGAAWLSTLDLLEREATRPNGLVRFPLAAAHLESLIVDGLLLTHPHNYSDALVPHAVALHPRAVRRAVDLMQDRPEHPWSTAALAAAVAVSARTLQEGFARSFGIPPMAYLREIRLDRIHAELLAAEPGTLAVSIVAARWGFLHAGRFSAAYTRRFGCWPSETARR
jgi:AraC-like DNA-binding protein